MTGIVLLYVNSFAILVLVLVLRNYRQKFKFICCEEKVFILFSTATIIMLLNEAALENLWGQAGGLARVVLYATQTIDYCLAVIIPMLWLYYCLFRIHHITGISRWVRSLIALPAAAYIAAVLTGLPGGTSFGIDANDSLVQGYAYIASYVVGFIYITAAAVFIIIKHKRLNRGELIPYLLVPIIPVTLAIGEIISPVLTGLMWAGTSLVILEIQMFVLNAKTNVDHLTGLNNRMALDAYVKRCIQESHISYEPLGLIMIDIDKFKRINDQYGHVEGDRALKATADILRECFVGKHFIARYGGDEFAVVLKDCSHEQMAQYIQALEQQRQKHNQGSSRPYEIMLSIGASVFRETEITDMHTMFMKVDSLMYQDKNAKKELEQAAPQP